MFSLTGYVVYCMVTIIAHASPNKVCALMLKQLDKIPFLNIFHFFGTIVLHLKLFWLHIVYFRQKNALLLLCSFINAIFSTLVIILKYLEKASHPHTYFIFVICECHCCLLSANKGILVFKVQPFNSDFFFIIFKLLKKMLFSLNN